MPDVYSEVSPTATPFEIADRLALVKSQEDALKARRIALEAHLALALGFSKPKGSKTYTVTDEQTGTALKVTCDQPVSGKVDAEEWEAIEGQFPVDLCPVRVKYEPDAKRVTELQRTSRELFLLFCRAYSTHPGKVSVRVDAK